MFEAHKIYSGGREGDQGGPRVLVAGESWGRRGDGRFQRRERVGAWLAVPKRSKSRKFIAYYLA